MLRTPRRIRGLPALTVPAGLYRGFPSGYHCFVNRFHSEPKLIKIARDRAPCRGRTAAGRCFLAASDAERSYRRIGLLRCRVVVPADLGWEGAGPRWGFLSSLLVSVPYLISRSCAC